MYFTKHFRGASTAEITGSREAEKKILPAFL
jgi:hypothetical protein